ncbi:hypothetical protein BVRB_6g132010 [Beta vulgaris subsp. vulgaris]|nr:hypothetical protein BVRB_6g132010 [Beta vulgaris subsp. vulgaris]
MLGGKSLGCGLKGDRCNLITWCCNGYECSNSYTGGTCVEDPESRCSAIGQECGFFSYPCCGREVCSATFAGGRCR